MDFLEALKNIDNYTYTENGAVALRSTGNAVLDAFGSLGGMKEMPEKTILDTFYKAFYTDKALAMKLLFYIRDCRGGQGMRRVFRTIVRSLAFTHSEFICNNLNNIMFFGRGDDFLCLIDTPCEDYVIAWIYRQLDMDIVSAANHKECSLLAKWLPSENASSKCTKYYAERIRTKLNLSPKAYRKMLSALRQYLDVVECKMSANDWEKIRFEKVPSKASVNYMSAFINHTPDRYINYITDVENGNSKINASVLFPVNITERVFNSWYFMYNTSETEQRALDALWNALPNYFEGLEETGLCVVDTSGSMYGTPINVAISLGIYCADKCNGPFKNHFITFSAEPKLQEIKGDTISDKVDSVIRAEWGANTDIEKVFDLILNTAIEYNMSDSEIPKKLYIISDMQWDPARNDSLHPYGLQSPRGSKFRTFIQSMEDKYRENGYTLPAIVYWNVKASECGMFQQKATEHNCCMVSGYSPSLFEAVIRGTEYEEEVTATGEKIVRQKLDPITIMTNTLNSERYDRVWTGIWSSL